MRSSWYISRKISELFKRKNVEVTPDWYNLDRKTQKRSLGQSALTLYDKLKTAGKIPGPQLNVAELGVHELTRSQQSIEEGDETEDAAAMSPG